MDFESGLRFDRPFRFGHFGCDGKYRMSDDEKRGFGLMKCPYCGCDCDSSAVGDHAFDCRGYGENAETGPDESGEES